MITDKSQSKDRLLLFLIHRTMIWPAPGAPVSYTHLFLRRSCKAQKLGRKGDKDRQNVGSQDSAEGKKSADSPRCV